MVGMLQSMATAYNATWDNSASGANFSLQDEYWKQRSGLLKQDIVMPEIRRKDGEHMDFSDIGRHYAGEDTDIDTESLRAYDAKVEELRVKFPDMQLKNSKQMWEEQKARGQAAAALEEERRGTTMGAVGGFLGDFSGQIAAGSTSSNKLVGAATVGSVFVGGELLVGAKAGIVPLMASEAAVQGGAAAVQELGGARSYRGVMGGDASYGGSVVNVLEAAGGGALLRGAMGSIAKGTGLSRRRWFADMPNDKAPPPPNNTGSGGGSQPDFIVGKDGTVIDNSLTPEQSHAMAVDRLQRTNPDLGRTRTGMSRVLNDMDEVSTRLDSWDNGERPSDMVPRTDTAIPDEYKGGFTFSDDINTRAALGRLTVDELARRADPDAFRIYDALAAKIETIRNALSDGKPDTADWARQITEANNKVSELTDQIGNRKLKPKERAALVKQRDEAMALRDEVSQKPRTNDTPRQSEMRDMLQQMDHKMRDMAPVISRAYARARGQFHPDTNTAGAVKRMVEGRGTKLSETDARALVDAAETKFNDPRARAGVDAPPGAAAVAEGPTNSRVDPNDLSPDKPYVEAATKVVEKDAKTASETLESFRATLDSLLNDKKAKTVTIGNHTFNLSDELEHVNVDGEGSRKVTVRELLDEIRMADEEAKAVHTCSI